MSETSHASGHEELPRILPLFPLEGALLLPQGRLPLHIFEPRYRAMTRDSMAGLRMIGMIQPTSPETLTEQSSLYGTGCAGKITAFSETVDGRYHITLTGVCRFDLVRELESDTPYRQALVTYDRYRDDLYGEEEAEDLEFEGLMRALRSYLDLRDIPTDWKALEAMKPDLLINTLAMSCPFRPNEKQALLEAASLHDRLDMITALLEMSVMHPQAGDGGSVQ